MRFLGIFHKFKFLAVVAVFFAHSLPAWSLDRANIDAFLDVTGFDVALDSLAFSADQAPIVLGLDEDDFGADWDRVTGQVFDKDVLRDMARGILAETLTPELLSHAAEFYASDLGQKVVAVENASHSHEDRDGKQEEGARLLEELREKDRYRVTVLERLSTAVDSSGHSVKAYQEVVIRLILAASAAGILDVQVDERALRQVMKADEEALSRDLQESAITSSAFAYRDISTKDLEAYAEALEHPNMQQVYELMNAIQFEILANRYEVLARRMAEIYGGEEL